MKPSFAVLLKVHFWDDFTRRQLKRLSAKVGRGRICVVVDETNGPVGPVEHDWVIRLSVDETARIGLAPKAPWGHVFHYNVDYPLYYFFNQNHSFDYYVMTEYDAVSNIQFDNLIEKMTGQKFDIMLFPMRMPLRDWEYTRHHAWIYPEKELRAALLCTSVYSRRAVEQLFQRRLELSLQEAEKPLPFWPFCEAFVPTEAARAGFAVGSFADFYNMDRYECWPPAYEDDVEDRVNDTLVHPVLTGDRYLYSTITYEGKMLSYFSPTSPFRKKLERFPRAERDRVFYRELRLRLINRTRAAIANLFSPRYLSWKIKKILSPAG